MNIEAQRHNASTATAAQLLVVDDDALITATLAGVLRQAGYVVAEATSPKRALELCAAQTFELAIVDERMPSMTGTQLAHELRERYNVPVAFLSAYSERELIEGSSAVGALGFFIKPLDPQRMLPALHNILARARELRGLRTREVQLQSALANEREINTAVGFLMERLHTTRDNAFESLRRYARSQRQQVAKIAAELLHSLNETQRLVVAIGAHNPGSNTERETRIKLKIKPDDVNQ
jgi:two-component system, response regulator PdtaR